MPVIINKTARAVTVSHRCDGLIHKLVLNPGINAVDDKEAKHFASCEYITALKKAKKISVYKSMADVDEDDMPSSVAKMESVALSPQMVAAEKALAEREAKLAEGEKALAEAQQKSAN